MFDMDKIKNLTVDEILIINGLHDVAKEAKQAANLIRNTYHSFGIGEEQIEVWSDAYNHEYITHSGVWQARYLHDSYDVICSEDEIFKYLRAEYLVKNGFAPEYTENYGEVTEEGLLLQTCKHFRGFLRRTQEQGKTENS